MSNLIKKNLAIKEKKLPARYCLTEEGRKLAARLLNKNDKTSSVTTDSAESDVESVTNQAFQNSEKENYRSKTVQPVRQNNPLISSKTIPQPQASKPPLKSVDDCIELSDSDSDIVAIIDKEKSKSPSPSPMYKTAPAQKSLQNKPVILFLKYLIK